MRRQPSGLPIIVNEQMAEESGIGELIFGMLMRQSSANICEGVLHFCSLHITLKQTGRYLTLGTAPKIHKEY